MPRSHEKSGLVPTAVGRRIAINLIAAGTLAGYAMPAHAQTREQLIERNPFLQELQRTAPDRLPFWLDRLGAILTSQPNSRGTGADPGGIRGAEAPQPVKRILDVNPDFRRAFQLSQDGSIQLIKDMLESLR